MARRLRISAPRSNQAWGLLLKVLKEEKEGKEEEEEAKEELEEEAEQEENEEAEEEEAKEEELCTQLLCLESNAYSLTVRSCLSHNRLTYNAESTLQHVIEHASGDSSWS